MKKACLFILVYCLVTMNGQVMYAQRQETRDTVYEQQQAMVISIIKNCQNRLPIVADEEIAHKGALNALQELHDFIKVNRGALECVIDTLQLCIDERYTDVENRVRDCIQNYEESEKSVAFPDTQLLQEKINNVVVSYYAFQLTLLGALDDCAQAFLQKTHLSTYLQLAKPWVIAGGIYFAIQLTVEALEDVIRSRGIKSDLAKNFLKEVDSTLFKAIIAGIFSPDIRNSAEKINKYVKENFEKSYAEIVSKYRKSGYAAKPSKESFESIKGYQDTKLLMVPTIDFCTYLTEYRAADIKLPRGYLFEGPLSDGRKMAQALASEITKKLKNIGESTQWLVYEIHGSSLVNRKLDKVLEECLEFGPAVLIINNIDWIYTQKDVQPEVYADIINKLSKYLSQESNFPLLICGTTQNHAVLDPVLLEPHKFEVIPLT